MRVYLNNSQRTFDSLELVMADVATVRFRYGQPMFETRYVDVAVCPDTLAR